MSMVPGDKGLKDPPRMPTLGSLRTLECTVRHSGAAPSGTVHILGKDWAGATNVNVGAFLERCLGWTSSQAAVECGNLDRSFTESMLNSYFVKKLKILIVRKVVYTHCRKVGKYVKG